MPSQQKKNHIECFEENVGKSKKKMDRWITQSFMGLPDNI